VPYLFLVHGTFMKIASLDRRLSRRLCFKTPLRVRVWKISSPEESTESLNLSQGGIYYATNSAIREGEIVEILLNMPEEITDEPSLDWRCTGHVVRVDRIDSTWGKMGVGVQFDCYEVSPTEIPAAS
jgi:hypothetical protein